MPSPIRDSDSERIILPPLLDHIKSFRGVDSSRCFTPVNPLPKTPTRSGTVAGPSSGPCDSRVVPVARRAHSPRSESRKSAKLAPSFGLFAESSARLERVRDARSVMPLHNEENNQTVITAADREDPFCSPDSRDMREFPPDGNSSSPSSDDSSSSSSSHFPSPRPKSKRMKVVPKVASRRKGRSKTVSRDPVNKGVQNEVPCTECVRSLLSGRHEDHGKCFRRKSGGSARCWKCNTHECSALPVFLRSLAVRLVELWDPEHVSIPGKKTIPNKKSARVAMSVMLAMEKEDKEFIDLDSLSSSTQSVSPVRSVLSPSAKKKSLPPSPTRKRKSTPTPQSPVAKRAKSGKVVSSASPSSRTRSKSVQPDPGPAGAKGKGKQVTFSMDDDSDLDEEYHSVGKDDIVDSSDDLIEKKKQLDMLALEIEYATKKRALEGKYVI
ncbi:hypothetical protein BCIN_05g00008 [Botrytis cinerea B05.10]|uniref:Uncharacterized protein n=3 Tax=Botryotinia fuckeliana (strain B05.10) TaxID=332648 RepID=A0A384JGM4_BOTFB|nr:hypothetical protein BCIN_05g00008 [Botrytis cinerea B05.10]ATZ49571.1 hypothetical protein BCIN_05g00008 [Botrytis cinerea B05.10]